MSSLSIIRIRFLGPLVPASVKVGRGKVYRTQKYLDYVEALRWLLKAQWVGKPPDGKAGWGVRLKIWAARGDIDNLAVKPTLDAATGVLWQDDRQVRYIEATLSRNGPGTLEAEFFPLKKGGP